MIAKLIMELPEDVTQVRTARRVGTCLLESASVVPQDVEDVELVIGEICTNVVRHARSEQGSYRLTLELHPDRLIVVVEDRGAGFDPSQLLFAPATLRPDGVEGGNRFGGLGLPLARALTDRLIFRETDPTGTTVYAEKVFRHAADKTGAKEARV